MRQVEAFKQFSPRACCYETVGTVQVHNLVHWYLAGGLPEWIWHYGAPTYQVAMRHKFMTVMLGDSSVVSTTT
jgi:hypothetical protein